MNAKLNMGWIPTRAGIGVLILAALFGCGGDEGGSPSQFSYPLTEPAPEIPRVPSPAVVGQPAPDFTLKKMNGRTGSLSDYRGAPVLVEFWASSSPICHLGARNTQKLFETFEDEGLTILGVSLDDPFEPDGRHFVERYRWTFPVLLASEPVLEAYNVRAMTLPVTFVVNSEGILVQKFFGPLPFDKMVNIVQNVLRDE